MRSARKIDDDRESWMSPFGPISPTLALEQNARYWI
jgi:hypothetical protein